jgi:hypothetical protein
LMPFLIQHPRRLHWLPIGQPVSTTSTGTSWWCIYDTRTPTVVSARAQASLGYASRLRAAQRTICNRHSRCWDTKDTRPYFLVSNYLILLILVCTRSGSCSLEGFGTWL